MAIAQSSVFQAIALESLLLQVDPLLLPSSIYNCHNPGMWCAGSSHFYLSDSPGHVLYPFIFSKMANTVCTESPECQDFCATIAYCCFSAWTLTDSQIPLADAISITYINIHNIHRLFSRIYSVYNLVHLCRWIGCMHRYQAVTSLFQPLHTNDTTNHNFRIANLRHSNVSLLW